MMRLLRGCRRALRDYCLRPLWKSLAVHGAIFVGPDALGASGYAARSSGRFAGYAQGGFLALPPGVGGPPAAHPERLRQDVALSEQERLLARDLWPLYEPRARDGG